MTPSCPKWRLVDLPVSAMEVGWPDSLRVTRAPRAANLERSRLAGQNMMGALWLISISICSAPGQYRYRPHINIDISIYRTKMRILLLPPLNHLFTYKVILKKIHNFLQQMLINYELVDEVELKFGFHRDAYYSISVDESSLAYN